MLSRKNWIYLTVFILALFELSPVIAKEASPRNIVETLLNSITNLKTGKPLTPEEVKKMISSLIVHLHFWIYEKSAAKH